MKTRTCHNCAKEKICNLKTVFNINEDVGCIDFIDDNYIQKEYTNTLNRPVMDPRFGPDTFYAGTPWTGANIVLKCEKIILQQGSIEITIDDKTLDNCPVLIINGKKYVAEEKPIIKCPHCGKSHYRENYMTSTLIGWSPIVKDGVRNDHNPNTITTHCTCLECGKEFSINSKGEVK